MAKEVRTASPKEQQKENPKYAMRTWLLRLGFIGDEFKTAREILTKRLAGDTAFRNGRGRLKGPQGVSLLPPFRPLRRS